MVLCEVEKDPDQLKAKSNRLNQITLMYKTMEVCEDKSSLKSGV